LAHVNLILGQDPANRLEATPSRCFQNAKKPWRIGQGFETILRVPLRRRGRDLMQLRRVLLLVLGKHDVDLRIRRNGDNDAAIGIEVHDL
jgi:hypothetical protein